MWPWFGSEDQKESQGDLGVSCPLKRENLQLDKVPLIDF